MTPLILTSMSLGTGLLLMASFIISKKPVLTVNPISDLSAAIVTFPEAFALFMLYFITILLLQTVEKFLLLKSNEPLITLVTTQTRLEYP